jgi:hypothetical protein
VASQKTLSELIIADEAEREKMRPADRHHLISVGLPPQIAEHRATEHP